jgi:hypothetical protein
LPGPGPSPSHRSEQKLRDFAPTTLGMYTCTGEYSNQAKFNTFLLNHLWKSDNFNPKVVRNRAILFATLLFNDEGPKSSNHAIKKDLENQHFIFCSSFQNLRLGSINLLIFQPQCVAHNPRELVKGRFVKNGGELSQTKIFED